MVFMRNMKYSTKKKLLQEKQGKQVTVVYTRNGVISNVSTVVGGKSPKGRICMLHVAYVTRKKIVVKGKKSCKNNTVFAL